MPITVYTAIGKQRSDIATDLQKTIPKIDLYIGIEVVNDLDKFVDYILFSIDEYSVIGLIDLCHCAKKCASKSMTATIVVRYTR